MEIRNQPASQPPQRTDITRPNREAIEKAAPDPVKVTDEDLASIRKRGQNYRKKVKQEIFEHRAHEARKRVTERARKRGQNYRKKIKSGIGAAAGPDKVQLSGAAQALAHAGKADAASDAGDERVAELKALYTAGRLNTEDLIARTAFRLLGGDRG